MVYHIQMIMGLQFSLDYVPHQKYEYEGLGYLHPQTQYEKFPTYQVLSFAQGFWNS